MLGGGRPFDFAQGGRDSGWAGFTNIGGRCGARFGQARVGGAGIGGAGILAAEEDVGLGQVGPPAFLIEARKGADGANDCGGSDLDGAPLLDELFDDPAGVLAAKNVEAGGAGVTVERIRVRELEIAANEVDTLPLQVNLFDVIDIRAAADLAFAAVAFEAGDGGDAFGDFCLGSAAERSASGRGRGEAGGVLDGFGGAPLCFGFGLRFGLGFADEWGLVVGRGKAVSRELGVVVGAALGDAFVEAVGEDDFDRGLFARLITRHECFLL